MHRQPQSKREWTYETHIHHPSPSQGTRRQDDPRDAKPPTKEELRIGDLQPYLDLMADGRERTVSDVALRLKQLERVATYNLNQLVNAGFLVQTKIGGIVVWKMKK
jgi:hypothetical protein